MRPFTPAELRNITRDYAAPFVFVPSESAPPTTLKRIKEALNNPFGFGFYVGFCGGCFFTVGMAFVWSLFL